MKCTECGAQLPDSARKCSHCGKDVPKDFNYNNMEKELLDTVIEEETLNGISGRDSFYQKPKDGEDAEDEEEQEKEVRRQPGKLAAALLICGALFTGGILFLQSFSTDYVYGKTEALYQDCLMKLAQEDYAEALPFVEQLLQEDGESLEYLALKNTICAGTGDKKAQKKVLKKIIKEDVDNYQAYEQLLQIYLENDNQDKIKKLEAEAPNSVIASMLREYIVTPPYLELTPGVYDASQQLAISSEGGHNIFYTLDGSSPLERGTQYYGPIQLEQDHYYSVRAVCRNANGVYGEESTGDYQIGINADRNSMTSVQIEDPDIYPESGVYTSPQRIVIKMPIGYQAYYSWLLGNMLTPENGTLYTGGITMPEGESILSVIVTDENGNSSMVKQVSYTYQPE